MHFWPIHPKFGEPDLLLIFSGGNQLPLCFIIEAKLWANKSGTGEQDQLNRYLATVKDTEWLNPFNETCRVAAIPGLIYLTPRSAWFELNDSVEHASDSITAQSELFLLQWQDVLEVSRQCFSDASVPYCTILNKIANFLERRGLQFFRGFSHSIQEEVSENEASFYKSNVVGFWGFTEVTFEVSSGVETNFYASE